MVYSVTPEGAATIEAAWPAVQRHVIHRFAGHFTEDEQETISSLLGRI